MMSSLTHGRYQVKKVLATLAALAAVIATPVFAQSFDPEAGTGNVLPSYYEADGGLRTGIAPPQNYRVANHYYGALAHVSATASSRGMHRRLASRLRGAPSPQ
jgi:hypothetical protein